ncbi:GTPase [Candidatus Vidania fulgoroideorum]
MKIIKPIISISTCNDSNSGIGIIRISSGENKYIIKRIINDILKKKFLFPRLATFSKIFIKGSEIDSGIAILFPKNKSYTGEDVLEIQSHGSRKIINKIFIEIVKKYKVKKAKKGEFTSRALNNGKIDFFDIEKIYSIYNTDCNRQIEIKKKYKKKFERFNKKIFNIKLLIENEINFHYDKKNFLKIKKKTIKTIKNIKNIFNNVFFEKKKKINISIIGKENVGKSTLFNILINKKRSIISNFSGTTTNFLKKKKKEKQIEYNIYDTAGLNCSNKKISKKIKHENKKIIKKSDIILIMTTKKNKKKYYNKNFKKKKILLVYNKLDLNKSKIISNKKEIFISCKLLFGIDKLKKKIFKNLKKIYKKKKNQSLINKETKKIYKEIKPLILFINRDSYSLEILYEKIDKFQKKICNFFSLKNKKITKEIFKKFCIGK